MNARTRDCMSWVHAIRGLRPRVASRRAGLGGPCVGQRPPVRRDKPGGSLTRLSVAAASTTSRGIKTGVSTMSQAVLFAFALTLCQADCVLPVRLFNGKDLAGWTAVHAGKYGV